MPLIKRLIKISGARCLVIPKSWLEFYEREAGQEIIEIAVEVNKVLTVAPIIPKKEETA